MSRRAVPQVKAQAPEHDGVLFVSPHLDDAVLSCGGLLATLRARSVDAVVATVFTAMPDPMHPTPLAREFHAVCGISGDGAEVRRREDRRALASLGVGLAHLNLPECLYRFDLAGQPRYPTKAAIYEPDFTDEPDIVAQVSRGLETILGSARRWAVYLPLGVGRHVDHLIARRAAECLMAYRRIEFVSLFYYEDLPYACGIDERSWSDLRTGMRPELEFIDGAAWREKLAAIQLYTSQLSMLWAEPEAMRQELTTYARRVGGGLVAERLWRARIALPAAFQPPCASPALRGPRH
jgi:LmbE family N-acetylglucosaminyl deacetylase